VAQGYMNRGELVPDDVTIAMVRDRLHRPDCAKGALLDGFPRTPAQADALAVMLAEFSGKVDVVPYINVPSDVLIERLGGRWSCKVCGRVYHEKNMPPKEAGRCDDDHSELYLRDDDKPETVARRIQVFFAQTQPLIEYYTQRGLLAEVDGTLGIEKVSEDLMAVIQKD
jgi:adenylate kinase